MNANPIGKLLVNIDTDNAILAINALHEANSAGREQVLSIAEKLYMKQERATIACLPPNTKACEALEAINRFLSALNVEVREEWG